MHCWRNCAEKIGGVFVHNTNDLNDAFHELGNAPEVPRAKLERTVTLTDAVAEFPMDVALQNDGNIAFSSCGQSPLTGGTGRAS